MKRIILLLAAMCLMLTACGAEPQMIEPMTTEDLSTIYTDWSKLEPYDSESICTYYEPRSEDGLLNAGDDYGMLIRYLGAESESEWNGTKRCYGLVTTDGRIVTEPVYSEIYHEGSFIVLKRTQVVTEYYEDWDYSNSNIANVYTIAAWDGSWVKEMGMNIDGYSQSYCLMSDDLIFYFRNDHSAVALNSKGKIVSEFPSSVIADNLGKITYRNSLHFFADNQDVVCVYDYYSGDDMESRKKIYLNLRDGTVSAEAPQISDESTTEEEISDYPEVEGYDEIMRTYDMVTEDEYFVGVSIRETDYVYKYTYDLLSEDGELILDDFVYGMVENGLVGAIRNDYFCYYSIETGELSFRFPVRCSND